jgi:hypothetical protein
LAFLVHFPILPESLQDARPLVRLDLIATPTRGVAYLALSLAITVAFAEVLRIIGGRGQTSRWGMSAEILADARRR